MKIIDAHAHIFPSKIADKAVHSISDFYEIPMNHNGSCEELLKSGKTIGVDKYLVFSTATTAHQVESINSFMIEQKNRHSEFIALGTMFIDYEHYADELKRLKDNGINGIKLHPDFQKFNIDDKKLYPVYDTLKELNMFVLTHAGDYRYGYSHPERIAKVANDFPKLNIIAAHFGGWSQWDVATDYLVLPNVYYDTSSTYGFTGTEPIKKAFEKYDNTHIFFGTDFPMWDHAKEFESVKKFGLSDDLFERVMAGNFVEFYKKYDSSFTL